MDLFDFNNENKNSRAPLADRMRANTLDEFFGQKHIVDKNSLLSRAIRADKLGSCIFWGPPGCGKSTLANIISHETKGNFVKLNAVTSGVADVKKVIEQAKDDFKMFGKRTYLLLDECHRFSKTQSDSLLPAIESGDIMFIGSTTENPYIAMTPAIVSRCRVFELVRLTDADILDGLKRCMTDERGLKHIKLNVSDDALNHIVHFANGDLRNAYNSLELAALSTYPDKDGIVNISLADAEESTQQRAISVDENLYYDLLSAFCKSLRGSDVDAAVYYSERLISAGCSPLLIARRLIAHSAEDVGLANPQAMVMAVSAYTAFEKLGLPEGRLPLTEAIMYVCLSPKSNSVVTTMDAAREDAENNSDDDVPFHLRDTHYKGAEKRNGVCEYLYPHDFGGYVDQQYLPNKLKDKKYYTKGKNGEEAKMIVKKDGE
ncbi:MAG: replication-associated recombination protein A [Clostridia bacterium]